MFKHLFKLIWNKKKQNFLLMSEMLVSFLVIFAVFSLMVYYYTNYKKPMGFDYQNLWVVNYNNTLQTKSTDSLNLFYDNLKQGIKSMPEVREVSSCSDNVPFSNNQWTGIVSYNKAKVQSENYIADDNYQKTLNLTVTEGRWFEKGDAASKNPVVVINEDLKEKLFGKGQAVGKLVVEGDNDPKAEKKRIVGVIQSVKKGGDYSQPRPAIYKRADTGSYHWVARMMVQVRPGADATFEGKLYKYLANNMKTSNVEIEHMENKRKSSNLFNVIPMIVTLIVACFLVINVALGLFGVMWYNINKRRGEIGLRRAIGATGKSVSSQLVSESMILATLSLIVGIFFAVQFPLLNVFDLAASIYLTALALSIIFIYLLVLVCSLYPGKQAAAIYPAVALHED